MNFKIVCGDNLSNCIASLIKIHKALKILLDIIHVIKIIITLVREELVFSTVHITPFVL